jgi:hypothetical protein
MKNKPANAPGLRTATVFRARPSFIIKSNQIWDSKAFHVIWMRKGRIVAGVKMKRGRSRE